MKPHIRKKKFLKKDEAEKVFNKIGDSAAVIDVTESIRKVAPPVPFNTTGLIVAANSIGFSAVKTINVAESLYMNGFISYPRTDNTVYPNSLNLRETTKILQQVPAFKEAALEVNRQEKINPSRGNKRSTDHPPIYPTSAAQKTALSEDDWKLYELVSRRFIATLLPAAELKSVSASIDVGGETFIANGSNIIKANWIAHYPYYKHEDVFIPELSKGQILKSFRKRVSGQTDKTAGQVFSG